MADVTPDDVYTVLEEFIMRLLGMGESESMDTLVAMDLSFSQVRALFVLAQHGEPIAINEVAECLRMSVAAAGRNIDQLVCQELVLRREDPEDRRIKRVSLTESGRSLVSRHLEDKRDELRAFAGRLDQPDRRRLLEALQPILAGDALRARSQEFCT
ncbi:MULTISPECIES: MarR family winged helix-turn-helix transcriptional regulator [Prescottella]|uniref:MarR family transcriptional regulator n=2 Tax=Rhodococcus hoagii TaxID=43767 RepID=A0AAE5IQV1_RHOHA|nr:MarR family transcriptional regulator [Prescottella equi]ORL11748.1 MarR family transcriptional regulator [Prescottella equi]ORL26401.1 MarR family transcriptional regulator [Prescottella equi]ORL98980.1 MarR family transcriptional regulator [Prescottella equi]ORM07929.1 MarR family transcriptional regulator [Prescottella equi]ORM23586.1 MarR family transcriptional regulator [Prescottella equi]